MNIFSKPNKELKTAEDVLKYLKKIPDRRWVSDVFTDRSDNRNHCALGHLGFSHAEHYTKTLRTMAFNQLFPGSEEFPRTLGHHEFPEDVALINNSLEKGKKIKKAVLTYLQPRANHDVKLEMGVVAL